MRKLYVSEKLYNFAYNLKFKAIALFQEYPIENILQSYQIAYLLGKEYECNPANQHEKNQQLATSFRDIIWITYRSGFPQLLKDSDSSFVTDTGWGCMIRVGQMLFAQIIKDYFKPKSTEQYQKICSYFNDFSDKMPFSIQKIAQLGKKQFNLMPGQWYNPAQIAYILSGFLNDTKNPQLSKLKSIVFNNSSLFFDQIIQIFNVNGYCSCGLKKQGMIVCQKCVKSDRSIVIIILVRLGLNEPQKQYLQILSDMFGWKWFRGVIGGKPKKALYFVGRKEDEYIYLDPHYVQEAKKQISSNKNSYFCQSFRRCKNTSIDPSLGISFYLQSLKDLNEFYSKMMKAKSSFKDFFIFVQNQTPNYLQKSKSLQPFQYIPIEFNNQDVSGQFQVIQ